MASSAVRAHDLPMLVFVLLAVVIVCVAAATVAGNRGGAPTKASRGLAVAALLAAALAAGPMFALVWDDSGLGFALAVTGVPLALVTAGSFAARRTGAPATAGGWLCVLLLAVYVVLFALGAGFFFVPATLLLLASMFMR